jgi:hypothetical protein
VRRERLAERRALPDVRDGPLERRKGFVMRRPRW